MSTQLTQGAIKEIRLTGNEESVVQPVLQILSVKGVGTNGQDRYRAIISDGECFIQAMFAVALNPRIAEDEVVRNCIVRINHYTVNAVKDKTIVIIHDIDVLENCEGKIGEPAGVDSVIEAETNAGKDSDSVTSNGNNNSRNNSTTNGNGNAGASSRGGARGGAAGGRGGRGGNSSRGGRGGNNNNGGGRGGGDGAAAPVYPIEGLSPYQNKWTIKGRVTNKSDIRHWSNNRGDGKLFSFVMLDESGEIKITGFNDQCDAFYNMIEDGKVYFLSRGKVGIAKKQFSNVNNEYEITLESGSEITPCTDTENVPQVKYNFVDLSNLESVEKDAHVDVIGIIKEYADVTQIISKASQKPINKRELTLVDNTGMSVRLTLWGRQAENFATPDGSPNPVVAFKGVRVGDFGGRSLSMMSGSSMMMEPDIEEANTLRGWYDDEGATTSFNAYTNAGGGGGGNAGGSMQAKDFKHIGEAKDQMLGTNDEPDFFAVRAQLVYIKKDALSYPACPTDNKKMHLENEGSWRCEKCEKHYDTPAHRYVLSGQFADFTGFFYFSAFDDVGRALLGKTADEMEQLRADDEATFNATIDEAMGAFWNLSIKARNETFNDQSRIRYNVMKAVRAEWKGEQAKRLTDLIDSYDS